MFPSRLQSLSKTRQFFQPFIPGSGRFTLPDHLNEIALAAWHAFLTLLFTECALPKQTKVPSIPFDLEYERFINEQVSNNLFGLSYERYQRWHKRGSKSFEYDEIEDHRNSPAPSDDDVDNDENGSGDDADDAGDDAGGGGSSKGKGNSLSTTNASISDVHQAKGHGEGSSRRKKPRV